MKRNLSIFERLIRPLLGLIVASVALSRPEFGWLELALLVCAVFLVLNGVLARCYLWRALGVNTARNEFDLCSRQARSQSD